MAATIAVDDGLCMQTITSDLVIRPVARTDRERLAEAFSALSEDTRRRRFGGLASRLGARDLDRLTDIDHHEHEALAAVATDSGRIVGVARYVRLPHDPVAAEVAIAVDDGWQGRGVGRRLMRQLAERARDEGITRMLAYVGVDNGPVLGWLGRAGGVAVARDGEAILFAIPLGGSGAERRAA
jgi:GNAT superfamily N-acetyltransferase